jgi:hypothetical protein
MMDLQVLKQRREELMREVRQDRLAKDLRGSRERRVTGLATSLVWEIWRGVGNLRKLSRRLKKPDHERKETSGR